MPPLNPSDAYRAIYRTLFWINEAHDRRSAAVACNDNASGWAA
jgi:hypothetical protein